MAKSQSEYLSKEDRAIATVLDAIAYTMIDGAKEFTAEEALEDAKRLAEFKLLMAMDAERRTR